MEDEYANFADLYDSETADPLIQAFYQEWTESLVRAVERFKVPVGVLVDLACGTGNSTVPWTKRRGWKVIGVDRSAAMLREARRKSGRVRWVCQDLTALAIDDRADVVTCHFDALNHVLEPGDLQQVFVNVARVLHEGGLFQFDVNTEHMLRWLGGHEKLFRVGRDYFVAHNEYDPKRGIATFHQLWFIRKGRVYEKREVIVHERAYTTREIRRMLRHAGLQVLRQEVQRQIEGKPTRMLYVARKRPAKAARLPRDSATA
jgi:ubiquinone/menaquinone biosynthesis C-methylase UbiE